jgi:hypothetical protein
MRILILLCILPFVSAQFGVISDIHYDQYYTTGAPTLCVLGSTGMGCCRSWNVALNGSMPAPEYGITGCDSPHSMLKQVFEWLREQPLEFLIYLGDGIDHDLLAQNYTYNLEELTTVAQLLATLPYPVYSVLGNHDSYIVDNLWDNTEGMKWIQMVQSLYNLPPEFITHGYYNLTWHNIRMIFINCLSYDNHNVEVDFYPRKDLFNQTQWLMGQIKDAQDAQQIVYVFSHFSANAGEAVNNYSQIFSSITYPLTLFVGHSHYDHLETVPHLTYIHPSVMPDGHFPEIRIYTHTNGIINNYFQHGFNLSSLNFELVYDAQSSYNLPNLNSTSWSNFMIDITTNSTLAKIYKGHVCWGYPLLC